ncbi:hypothetical protein CGCF415_v011285 [Colletotrichum fructicola]|nr:hypothetical protein CGCFRS4_v010628 [Colletotrichum fructicola]KAF4897234.1 hypothetical protein CGCF415_v011285 [Colletotrichum fructicola]KAF4930532.1 hypothetical protein CGCF245_v011570 [Colletotrichum fructicola]
MISFSQFPTTPGLSLQPVPSLSARYDTVDLGGWTQSLTLNGQCKQPFGCERGRCLCATSSSTGARKTAKSSIKKRAPSPTDTRPWDQNYTSLEDANSAPTVRGDMTVTDLGDGFHSRITLATWYLRRNHPIDRRLERANEPFRSTSHDAQKNATHEIQDNTQVVLSVGSGFIRQGGARHMKASHQRVRGWTGSCEDGAIRGPGSSA